MKFGKVSTAGGATPPTHTNPQPKTPETHPSGTLSNAEQLAQFSVFLWQNRSGGAEPKKHTDTLSAWGKAPDMPTALPVAP